MSEKKQDPGLYSRRAKVWASLITTTLGAVASLISALVSWFGLVGGENSTAEILRAPLAIVAAIGAVLISVAFTFVLTQRERGPSRVARLKNVVADAYLGALDSSALNPNAGRAR
jgi:hypothetical protein